MPQSTNRCCQLRPTGAACFGVRRRWGSKACLATLVAVLFSLQVETSARSPEWTDDAAAAVLRPKARSLRAVCLRDNNGNINCISEQDTSKQSQQYQQQDYLTQERRPTRPKNSDLLQYEVQGCKAAVSGKHTIGQDKQDYTRRIFSQLLWDPNCGFLARSLIQAACHDAWTFSLNSRGFDRNGANGSIRLEQSERVNTFWDIPRTISIVEDLWAWLSSEAGLEISFADLLHIGAAEAVVVAGGPSYRIRMGRVDATQPDVYDTFPDTDDRLQVQMAKFMSMGLYTQDFVALSAIHSVTGEPGSLGTSHFQRIQAGGGGQDQVLQADLRTSSWVEWFAGRQREFNDAFAEAMVKISELNTRGLT